MVGVSAPSTVERSPAPSSGSDARPESTDRARWQGPEGLGSVLGAWRPTLTEVVGIASMLACCVFVFVQMRPDLLFSDTTPSGGDMGAHVWGPAFLRDHLLPEGRLAGWTPDWYAGFPAYRFYMVVPSLAIIALNAGFGPVVWALVMVAAAAGIYGRTVGGDRRWQIWGAVAVAVAGIGLAIGSIGPIVVVAAIVGLVVLADRTTVPERRWQLYGAAVALAVLALAVPYGMAFKLVTVAGLISLPAALWAFGRLARAPEPIPALLPVAGLLFLFDTNFTIYGGNIASTLAGEFAFSISLSLAVLAMGVAVRGMDGDRWRVGSAIVIGLVALTHLIPVFFVMVALAALVMAGPTVPRLWSVAFAVAMALVLVTTREGGSPVTAALSIVAVVVVLAAAALAEAEVFARARWLALAGPTAAALSGFWLLPFLLSSDYFNDMGWERLENVGPALLTVPMKVALPIAAVGVLASIVNRDRVGLVFTTTGVVFLSAVANLPESHLWNARLLPFYYLSVYVLAAIGVGFVIRSLASVMSGDLRRPDVAFVGASVVVTVVGALIAVAMPLRILPGGDVNAEGVYSWMGLRSYDRSFIPSWTAWNYSGYEEKASYREYRSVVLAMDEIGDDRGCGRAMWEYDRELDRYGTPMALMLLPHWTDGCIGSMEGLYFESSATTPFHFLNQSTLSQAPSRAQRDLPYQDFDIERGVDQLQVMGVRYYMAQAPESIAAAQEHPDLIEVGEAAPFVIFEVTGSELVEGLDTVPVVATGPTSASELSSRFELGWLSQAVEFYNAPEAYAVLPAESGPDDWRRVSTILGTDGEPIDPASVSDIEVGTSSISFTVDEIGKPVLVKASYFPNWEADGAEGPWRAGPNLMVVVPTAERVELSYGRSIVDYLGGLVFLVGIAGLVGLAMLDRRSALLAADRSAVDGGAADSGADGGGSESGWFPRWSEGGWFAEAPDPAGSLGDEEETEASTAPVPADGVVDGSRSNGASTTPGAEAVDTPPDVAGATDVIGAGSAAAVDDEPPDRTEPPPPS